MQTSYSNQNLDDLYAAILKTMAFFSLYDLPMTRTAIHQLLYKKRATKQEIDTALSELQRRGKVVSGFGLYALKNWDHSKVMDSRREIHKRWQKVDRYFWVLSLIPFIHHVSVINSLAFGNAHLESDIDFFVVTKQNRLYFVRTAIILIFRLFGVYKTRRHINERFCFGFYVTHQKPHLAHVLIDGEDPLFAFWFASFAPLLNETAYHELVDANPWIREYFPNFDHRTRLSYVRKKNWLARIAKGALEIILTLPAIVLEPLLRSVHIRHTFNLPENHWPTSTTIANEHMLKLHALDPRKEIRQKFRERIEELGRS